MSNVQVSSTTDEDADIYRAVGATPPKSKSPDAEIVTAGSDKGISAITSAAAEEEEAPAPAESETASENQETEQKPDGVNRLQKRFDKLTRTIHEEREARQRAEQKLEELIARLDGGESAKAEPEPTKKPTPEQFSTYEDYVEALTDWKTEQKLTAAEEKFRQQEAARSQQQEFQKNLQRYNSRLLEVRDMYDDFDEVFASVEGEHPDYVRDAIIESDYGPDIAYYLAKNPKEYQEIAGSSQTSALRKIGRIEHAIALQMEGATATTAQKQGSPVKPRTNLGPTKPVGGSMKGTVKMDEMSYQDYVREREKQLKNRYKR